VNFGGPAAAAGKEEEQQLFFLRAASSGADNALPSGTSKHNIQRGRAAAATVSRSVNGSASPSSSATHSRASSNQYQGRFLN
jgi:hypothetical protein